MIEGIDVSKHNGSTPPLTGLDFLFARASIGLTPDALYLAHIANARAAGLVTGAYHFNWSPISPSQQADYFLAHAVGADLLVIDVEANVYNGVTTPAFSIAQTQEFIARVHAAGRKIGLYHSQSGFFSAGQDYNWIARWGTTPPSTQWTFWQYQGDPLDRNRYPGTRADLNAFAGKSPAPPKWEWDPAPIRLPEGARFECRGLVALWDPNKPGAPVAKISGSIAARWRAGFHRLDGYNVPSGRFFVQISAPGPYFNLWAVESDGAVVLPAPPVPPVVEQPPVLTLPPLPLPPLPSAPRSTRLPGGIEII